MNQYILEGKTPVLCNDIMQWAKWYETANRHVDKTILPDGTRVSTVFLGLDHGFDGQIMLFETMIFGGEHDQYCERYETWDEAEAGHKKAIEMIYTVTP